MNWLTIAGPFIRLWEKCVLTAYPDPATGADPWTIGDGLTGPDIVEGTVWTQDEADARRDARLQTTGGQIDSLVTVALGANQKAALASLTWNIGIGNFRNSTLLKLLNAGDYAGTALQFLVWNRAAGKVMQGLVNRRQAEMELFNTPDA